MQPFFTIRPIITKSGENVRSLKARPINDEEKNENDQDSKIAAATNFLFREIAAISWLFEQSSPNELIHQRDIIIIILIKVSALNRTTPTHEALITATLRVFGRRSRADTTRPEQCLVTPYNCHVQLLCSEVSSYVVDVGNLYLKLDCKVTSQVKEYLCNHYILNTTE